MDAQSAAGKRGWTAPASYLRELHGNLAGALELMQMAYQAASPEETEDRAWMLAQTSHLELLSGDAAKAEMYATSAFHAFPDYHFALAALARVRLAQGPLRGRGRILS